MTEPMSTKELEKLMSNFKPTEELDQLFGKALVDNQLPHEDMKKLLAAGYVTEDKDGEGYGFTEEGRKRAWEKCPKQAKVMWVRVEKIREKEHKKKDAERAKQERVYDQERADAYVARGLLVVRDGRYHNTPKGWADALVEFQWRLGRVLEDKNDYGRGYEVKIHSDSGDFEDVPVSQPWRYHDNVVVVKNGFRNIKKQIISSLSEEERELFGLPPPKLNRPAATAKAQLLEVITRYRDGAASDLVAAVKSRKDAGA